MIQSITNLNSNFKDTNLYKRPKPKLGKGRTNSNLQTISKNSIHVV